MLAPNIANLNKCKKMKSHLVFKGGFTCHNKIRFVLFLNVASLFFFNPFVPMAYCLRGKLMVRVKE